MSANPVKTAVSNSARPSTSASPVSRTSNAKPPPVPIKSVMHSSNVSVAPTKTALTDKSVTKPLDNAPDVPTTKTAQTPAPPSVPPVYVSLAKPQTNAIVSSQIPPSAQKVHKHAALTDSGKIVRSSARNPVKRVSSVEKENVSVVPSLHDADSSVSTREMTQITVENVTTNVPTRPSVRLEVVSVSAPQRRQQSVVARVQTCPETSFTVVAAAIRVKMARNVVGAHVSVLKDKSNVTTNVSTLHITQHTVEAVETLANPGRCAQLALAYRAAQKIHQRPAMVGALIHKEVVNIADSVDKPVESTKPVRPDNVNAPKVNRNVTARASM